MRKLTANLQSGSEGVNWLRNSSALDGRALSYFQDGKFSLGILATARNILRVMPGVDGQKLMLRLISDELEVMAIGAESVVIRREDKVKKYLTGKTEDPQTLLEKIKQRHEVSQRYVGRFMPKSLVYLERAQIFKGQQAKEYVCLEQEFVSVLEHDPHRREGGAPEHIQCQLADFGNQLARQFNETGQLMDVTNSGNIVWGSIGDGENQLYLIDTLSVVFPEKDFIGKKVPFWDPQIHLESLADLMYASEPVASRFPSLSEAEIETLTIS